MCALKRFCVIIIILGGINAQFLEQPDAGTVFAPVQDQVTLICSVEEGFVVDWHIHFADGSQANASHRLHRTQLQQQRGFTLKGVNTNRSTVALVERGNLTNNATNITCLAHERGVQVPPSTGNTVLVIFYGLPPLPAKLGVTDNNLGSLNISWSLGFIEGVPVNYTLTVLNLNTTSAQPIIIAGLLDQHFMFETNRPCDVYSFTVTAVTAAGNSTPSQEIIFTSMCFVTTTENQIPMTSLYSLFWQTTMSEDSSTFSSPPTKDNSTVTLIAAVSVVVAVIMTALVLINVIVCVCCYHKNKAEDKYDPTDPVYETPGTFSDKDSESPFAMTSSSAYGVSTNSHKLVANTKNELIDSNMTSFNH